MNLRMVPLHSLFVSLKRIVHSVAESSGKQIELVTSGGETPMDKALLEVVENSSIYLEEFARSMIGAEEKHQLELKKMLRDYGS